MLPAAVMRNGELVRLRGNWPPVHVHVPRTGAALSVFPVVGCRAQAVGFNSEKFLSAEATDRDDLVIPEPPSTVNPKA